MKNTIIGIILALLVVAGVYLYMQNKDLQKDADKSDIEVTLPLDTNSR